MVRSVFLPVSETFIYGEVRNMKRYEPFVFCWRRVNKGAMPHDHVVIDPGHRKLERMLKRREIELIHARFGMSGIRMMRLKKDWNVPLVTSFHGCDTPGSARMRKRRRDLQQLFKTGDIFTVPCRAMKQELVKHGCPERKIVVHYSGIDVGRFAFKERSFPAKGPVRILFVGRLVEKKGADILLKAFQSVRKAFPNTELRIVGNGVLRDRLKRLAKKLRVHSHVAFLGELPHREIAKQLESAHLFCLPSSKDRTGNQEGIPNALKEAMASGLPVVSTFHSGIPELIEDGVSGHLVPENNAGALAKKLIHLLERPDTWKPLGTQARAKIEAQFHQKKQTEKLESLFDSIIQRKRQEEAARREHPFFSVIIPTYNRERFIGKAIRSVLNQSCRDFEIIVVDDGSTDKTAKIVKSFGDQVRYIYQKNSGPSTARNTGIQHAKGKYIAFLDSDDRFLPNKLMENRKFLESHPECRFLYSWYYDVRNGRKMIRRSKDGTNLNKFRIQLYRRDFMIRTSTAVIHRSCFDQVGLFDPKYRYSQDWDMWLRLAAKYRGYCQPKALVHYRRHYRKPMRARKRHKRIRKTAYALYRWDRATLASLKRRYEEPRPKVRKQRSFRPRAALYRKRKRYIRRRRRL